MIVDKKVDTTDKCNPFVTIKSNFGCPTLSINSWLRFLTTNYWLIGSVLLIFGAFLTFFGRKFFPWTIALFGCVIGYLTTMLLFSVFNMLDSLD